MKRLEAGRPQMIPCQSLQAYSVPLLLGFVLVALLSAGAPASAQITSGFPVNDHHIIYHNVKTDSSGGIVPWYNPSPSVAYDHVIRLVWDFWKNMRSTPCGIPYYLQHMVWHAHEDDPRGIAGSQINMALDSWNLLYGYLGDASVQQNMIMMANYLLDHGMSKPGILWANLPYPYNTDTYTGQYDGDMQAGKGYLQPDKAGSFGAQLVILYKMTGNRRFLDAGIKIANTLADRVTPGNAYHSPWPLRVNAVTGEISKHLSPDPMAGTIYDASYTTNWTPTLTLFSELESLHQGHVEQYQHAAQLASAWIKHYPLRTNRWGPFFEDVKHFSDTDINADTMAAYILNHPEWDPQWQEDSKRILDWVDLTLGNHNFEKLQVMPIEEQTVFLIPGNSHTSRHASVELLYCEKTGKCSGEKGAVRQLNWATYSVSDDGKNRYPYTVIWLTDGYGDYVRHYLRSMASAPDLAPNDQNHLLRTSSVIQHIQYTADQVTYKKFDANSTELLKLGSATPESVNGGTMKWDQKRRVLIVHSTSQTVRINLSPIPR